MNQGVKYATFPITFTKLKPRQSLTPVANTLHFNLAVNLSTNILVLERFSSKSPENQGSG